MNAVHVNGILCSFDTASGIPAMATHFETLVVEIVDTLAPELDAFLEHKFLIHILLAGSNTGIIAVSGLDDTLECGFCSSRSGSIEFGLSLDEIHFLNTHNRVVRRAAYLVCIVVALVRTEFDIDINPRPRLVAIAQIDTGAHPGSRARERIAAGIVTPVTLLRTEVIAGESPFVVYEVAVPVFLDKIGCAVLLICGLIEELRSEPGLLAPVLV